MIPLKKLIFSELRQVYSDLETADDETLDKIIFYHRDGLRLKKIGFSYLKNIFTIYIFDLPQSLKSKHRIGMSKMSYPYYFTASKLVLFSELDSLVIKLQGGIEGFLENCNQINHDRKRR